MPCQPRFRRSACRLGAPEHGLRQRHEGQDCGERRQDDGPRTLDRRLYDGTIRVQPFLAIGLDLTDQDERVAHQDARQPDETEDGIESERLLEQQQDRNRAAPPTDLAVYSDWYLSPGHRGNAADGCSVAALASETVRQASGARAAMTEGLKRQIDRLSRISPGADETQTRRNAIGTWASIVGAMIMARMSDTSEPSDEVLRETRAWLAAVHTRWPKPRARTKGRSARGTG